MGQPMNSRHIAPAPESCPPSVKLAPLFAIFINGDLECAITLAAAAEGQLPNTTDPYLLKGRRACSPVCRVQPQHGYKLAKASYRTRRGQYTEV
jgi:hypothetical protein